MTKKKSVAGRKKRLDKGKIFSFFLDRPSIEKLILWQQSLRLSRSEALRAIIKTAPRRPVKLLEDGQNDSTSE